MEPEQNTTAIAVAMDNITAIYVESDEGNLKEIKQFIIKFNILDFCKSDAFLTPLGEDLIELARLVVLGYCKYKFFRLKI